MYLALFLHLYQPPTQFAKVLKDIYHASYERLLNSIRKYPSAKVTLNISASLTEQLVSQGFARVVRDVTELVLRGQIELTGSAAYHPLLTEIPREEIRRQILLNDAINRQYLGEVYQPRGFFPPEMAVNQRVLDVVSEAGFAWVLVDEPAVGSGFQKNSENSVNRKISPSENQKVRGSDSSDALKYRRTDARSRSEFSEYPLGIFVRNTDLSVKIAFSQIRTVRELISERPFDSLRSLKVASNDFVVLAMDGETFGHHRPEQLKFLEELFSSPEIELLTLSELRDQYPSPPAVTIRESSWGPWERWKNPRNPIHRLQWELTALAIDAVRNSNVKSQMSNLKCQKYMSKVKSQDSFDILDVDLPFAICHLPLSGQGKLTPEQKRWCEARKMLDRALHSDQYWWASAQPCWHYQMVKRGAKMLLNVVLTVPDRPEADKRRARELYDKILRTGLELYGDCVIE